MRKAHSKVPRSRVSDDRRERTQNNLEPCLWGRSAEREAPNPEP
jgi:hypothetical protein